MLDAFYSPGSDQGSAETGGQPDRTTRLRGEREHSGRLTPAVLAVSHSVLVVESAADLERPALLGG